MSAKYKHLGENSSSGALFYLLFTILKCHTFLSGVGGVAQWLECLPRVHRAVGLVSSTNPHPQRIASHLPF